MMQDTDNSDNISSEPLNPKVHPTMLRFSLWDRTETIDVAADQPIIIGRSADGEAVAVDLAIHHGRLLGVSRRHAVIFLTTTGVSIQDLHSANGTSRNGDPLEPEIAYDLRHGDEIKLGGLYVKVYFAD